jgi:hypothetical protein
MLKGNPNVFHYTTFSTADKLFSQHPIWQQARVESERKLIFDEYVAELKERDVVRYKFWNRPLNFHLIIFNSKKPVPLVHAVSQSWSRCSKN